MDIKHLQTEIKIIKEINPDTNFTKEVKAFFTSVLFAEFIKDLSQLKGTLSDNDTFYKLSELIDQADLIVKELGL